MPVFADLLTLMQFVAIFYGVLILLMASLGLVLAKMTQGAKAQILIGSNTAEQIREGQVARSLQESILARFYALALATGLVLFYVSIPFVIAGLLGATGFLLYLLFQARRIPGKLVAIIVVVGGGMAWAVLRSLFVWPSSGGFGLLKTRSDCPRLFDVLEDVARRVDTNPIDKVYVGPGASIGVHQEGRGPFGMFGVKQRNLSLGLATMTFLTIGEFRSILAHEYAHFSHKDTFFSRFIHQVHLSIQTALEGMGQTGGKLNYVNPFYWFLYVYHQAYNLLSAGHSRSREFLADRMACSLYGSKVFAMALTKAHTDGAMFEMTIYQSIASLLAKNMAFANMYEAFRGFINDRTKEEEREKLYTELLDRRSSLFDSHPSFRERIEAAAGLLCEESADDRPALELFDAPEELEKELTSFLTAYVALANQAQIQDGGEAPASTPMETVANPEKPPNEGG